MTIAIRLEEDNNHLICCLFPRFKCDYSGSPPRLWLTCLLSCRFLYILSGLLMFIHMSVIALCGLGLGLLKTFDTTESWLASCYFLLMLIFSFTYTICVVARVCRPVLWSHNHFNRNEVYYYHNFLLAAKCCSGTYMVFFLTLSAFIFHASLPFLVQMIYLYFLCIQWLSLFIPIISILILRLSGLFEMNELCWIWPFVILSFASSSSSSSSASLSSSATSDVKTMMIPGLTHKQIQTLPTVFQLKKEDDIVGVELRSCAICLMDMIQEDIVRRLLDCQHEFHVICIDPWLLRKAVCPLCQRRVNVK